MAAGQHHEPTSFHHVEDTTQWTLFEQMSPISLEGLSIDLGFHTFHITKFMLLQLVAAGLIVLIYLPIARRARNGELPKGGFWNGFEVLLTFIRDQVARPSLGEEDGDKFTPFLWTAFLFILFNNLLGMVPFMGSATGNIAVTGALALVVFVLMHGAPILRRGPIGYFKSHWPHMDVPYVGWLFSGMIFTIEMMGTAIKAFVLAVRLFANIFAGHMVLATILVFIYFAGRHELTPLWGLVTVGSVLGSVALSLLELFVAFLQAYIFTFLSALFLGMALHPDH